MTRTLPISHWVLHYSASLITHFSFLWIIFSFSIFSFACRLCCELVWPLRWFSIWRKESVWTVYVHFCDFSEFFLDYDGFEIGAIPALFRQVSLPPSGPPWSACLSALIWTSLGWLRSQTRLSGAEKPGSCPLWTPPRRCLFRARAPEINYKVTVAGQIGSSMAFPHTTSPFSNCDCYSWLILYYMFLII